MTTIEIKARLTKAQEKVEKTQKTIERHLAQAEKKKAIIEKNGWGFDRWAYTTSENRNEDAYWTICEYEGKLADAKNAEKKLEDAKQVVANWEEKLARAEAKENVFTEMPEVFKQVKAFLVDAWVKYDIAERERIMALKKELPYKEFYKVVPYTRYASFCKTDDEFRKMEDKEATDWLIDLYNRVVYITGEITDASGIRWGGKCLDGIIKGKNGTAIVETIGAGGYNIQRYHLRTLVKEA